MLAQLLNNSLTMKLVLRDGEHNFCSVITECGYTNEGNPDEITKRNKIFSHCMFSIKAIRNSHKERNRDILTQACDILIRNPTRHNTRLLQYILHSKNKMRDFV